jgi:hypothetical protein
MGIGWEGNECRAQSSGVLERGFHLIASGLSNHFSHASFAC